MINFLLVLLMFASPQNKQEKQIDVLQGKIEMLASKDCSLEARRGAQSMFDACQPIISAGGAREAQMCLEGAERTRESIEKKCEDNKKKSQELMKKPEKERRKLLRQELEHMSHATHSHSH